MEHVILVVRVEALLVSVVAAVQPKCL